MKKQYIIPEIENYSVNNTTIMAGSLKGSDNTGIGSGGNATSGQEGNAKDTFFESEEWGDFIESL